LNEGKVVGVARRYPTTLFDSVEEPLDPVAGECDILTGAHDVLRNIKMRSTQPRSNVCRRLIGKTQGNKH
jgi:hypothetical protein